MVPGGDLAKVQHGFQKVIMINFLLYNPCSVSAIVDRLKSAKRKSERNNALKVDKNKILLWHGFFNCLMARSLIFENYFTNSIHIVENQSFITDWNCCHGLNCQISITSV